MAFEEERKKVRFQLIQEKKMDRKTFTTSVLLGILGFLLRKKQDMDSAKIKPTDKAEADVIILEEYQSVECGGEADKSTQEVPKRETRQSVKKTEAPAGCSTTFDKKKTDTPGLDGTTLDTRNQDSATRTRKTRGLMYKRSSR